MSAVSEYSYQNSTALNVRKSLAIYLHPVVIKSEELLLQLVVSLPLPFAREKCFNLLRASEKFVAVTPDRIGRVGGGNKAGIACILSQCGCGQTYSTCPEQP